MASPESARANGISPRRDSPRRRNHVNARGNVGFEQAFEALRIEDFEQRKLRDYQRRAQAENADSRESAQAKAHEYALEQARIRHEAVRARAEAALKKWHEDQEAEQRRKAEEERLRQHREAEARAERDRQLREQREKAKRESEERARAEVERRRREQERAEAAERERQQREEEARQREEERQRQKREQAAAAARAAQQAEANAALAASAEAQSPERTHQEYQQLYSKIKLWKNDFAKRLKDEAKARKDPQIKDPCFEARRGITAEVGKLSDDKALNRKATDTIKKYITDYLNKPAKTIGTMIPVNNFLPSNLQLNDNNETKISDQSAFIICILVQRLVNLFYKYAFGEPHRAESLGVMASGVFAMPELQFERKNPSSPLQAKQSLFPILLAKYHHLCPALFGITGDQNTSAGKRKLGWALLPAADDGQAKTTFVSENDHFDRMKGLAVGYSSIALRNFSNSARLSNPYPPIHFWRSLAQIVNLPPEQITSTHVCVLRNMFGHRGISRFLLFFGSIGFAALRQAFVEFPKKLPPAMQQDSFVQELKIYVELLGKDEHMHLD